MGAFYKMILGMSFLAAFSVLGCQSTGPVAAGTSEGNLGITVAGEKTYILDWTGRTSGRPANPDWLGDAEEQNFTKYKEVYGIQSGICRLSIGEGADLKAAQMRATIGFAERVARQLATTVSNKSAQLARTGSMNDATAQAIEERTRTQSKADITGGELKTEYFKLIETVDSNTGKSAKKYWVYQIYVFPEDIWNQLQIKYLRSVIGEIPQNLKPEQREVAAMLNEMDQDERHPIELDQKQREQKLEAEKRMLDAQIDLLPAQQEAAARAELARLNQEALNERGRINADAAVAMKKAMEEGKVQQAAYLSGDPALQSAVGITAADAAYVNAKYLGMAAAILD
jgi:hypothetical protein